MFRKDLAGIVEYTPGKSVDQVKRELGLKKIVKLASNEVPFAPSARVKKAIISNLSHLSRYPDSDTFLLRQKIAKVNKLSAENVVVGHGSNELVRLLIQIVTEPGDEIIMPAPSFIYYKEAAKLMRGTPVEVSLKDLCLDLAAMKRAITKKTKAIFICNPNNPTATIVPGADIKNFLSGLRKDILVIFDEAYHEFVTAKNYQSGLDFFSPKKNIVVLRTFSKAYGLAGLRVGYGFASREVISMIRKVRDPFNVNSLAQAAALAALDDKTELKRRIREVSVQRKLVTAEVRKLGLNHAPAEANFVLIEVPEDSDKFTNKLLQLGAIVRSGKALGCPRHIRVTFGSGSENRFFLNCLAKALKMV